MADAEIDENENENEALLNEEPNNNSTSQTERQEPTVFWKVLVLLTVLAWTHRIITSLKNEDDVASKTKNSSTPICVGEELPDLIEVDPLFQYAKDILKIWHSEAMGAVCLSISNTASCHTPSLFGRLSGPSLSMLNWERLSPSFLEQNWSKISKDKVSMGKSNIYCGEYGSGVVRGAVYFVEVLMIFCQDFGVGQSSRSSVASNNSTEYDENWLQFNFSSICVEDIVTNRVTASGSMITIPKSDCRFDRSHHQVVADPIEKNLLGSWVSNKEVKEYDPLVTRIQPEICLPRWSQKRKESDNKWCLALGNLSRFDPYDFSWRPQLLKRWNSRGMPKDYELDNTALMLELCGNETDCSAKCTRKCIQKMEANTSSSHPRRKVCILGDSHSRYLTINLYRLNLGHWFGFWEVHYPEEIDADFLEKLQEHYGCRVVVLGTGQWASGWPALDDYGGPFTFGHYQREITRIARLAQSQKNESTSFQLFFITTHRMPLASTAQCPPKDWRTPTVIDSYNYLLKQVVRKISREASSFRRNKIHMLDTRFITSPMWDTPFDWCHFPRKVAEVEALFVAAKTLPNCAYC